MPLPIDSRTICIVFGPTGCVAFGTQHFIELSPLGSATTTIHEIKGIVLDSGGLTNIDSNGRVTVIINQLI